MRPLSLIPIAEVAGIGQPAVMCLNRIGINTLSDLLAANPDEVAYHLDSYDEATRVLDAARLRAKNDAAVQSNPLPARDARPSGEAPRGGPGSLSFQPAGPGGQPTPSLLSAALSLAAAHAGDDAPGHPGALGLSERLSAVALVLEHGGSAAEAAAAALHDAVLSPGWAMSAPEAGARFGPEVGALVEHCARIQGVPLSPMGRPQTSYIHLVAQAPAGARLICSAQALATVRLALSLSDREGAAAWSRFHGGRDFCIWYYRALSAAISAAGATPLADELAAAVERLARGVDRPARAA